MKKVVILTDSTADFSPDLLDELNVFSMPHYVRFDNEIYQDGLNLIGDEVYAIMKEKRMVPITIAPTIADFIKFFEHYIQLDYNVLYIGIGSKFSSAIRNAKLARDQVGTDRIFIVNSENISSGIAILVLKANDLRNKRMTAANIKARIDKLVPKVKGEFAIKNYQYLRRLGKVSRTKEVFRTVFWMKPVLTVEKGELLIQKKVVGPIYRAISFMFNDLLAQKSKIDLAYIIVTQSLANNQAIYLAELIKEQFGKDINIVNSKSGCVISKHCGPGAIGIHYLLKEKK